MSKGMGKSAKFLAGLTIASAFLVAANQNVKSQTLANNDHKIENTGSRFNIAEGNFGKASHVSIYGEKPFVLHISGGNDPNYDAKKYAEMFSLAIEQMAPDINYKVIYEEAGKDFPTLITPMINGFDDGEENRQPSEKMYEPVNMLNGLGDAIADYRRVVLNQNPAAEPFALQQ